MKCTECKVGYCGYRSTDPQRECPIQNGHRDSSHSSTSMPRQESGKGSIVPEGTRMVIDWSAFRREAAKDILPEMINWRRVNGAGANILISKEEAVKLAIEYADELIRQIKQE